MITSGFGQFQFELRAYPHYRDDSYFEIRIEYKWIDDKNSSYLTEIVPKERFINDEKFSKYFLDNLIDKAKSELWNRIKKESK